MAASHLLSAYPTKPRLYDYWNRTLELAYLPVLNLISLRIHSPSAITVAPANPAERAEDCTAKTG